MTDLVPSAELLERHGAFVRGLARYLAYDDAEAADAEQDVWAAAVQSPPLQQGRSKSWLSKVLRNALRQRRRTDVRRIQREHVAARPELVDSVVEVVAAEEIIQRVASAVVSLKEPYRSAVVLRFYEDLPPREIARRLEVPVETVRTRLRRAIGQLRSRLDDSTGGDREAWRLALVPLAAPTFPPPMTPVLPLKVAWAATAAVALGLLVWIAPWSKAPSSETPTTDNTRGATGDQASVPVLTGVVRTAKASMLGSVEGSVYDLRDGAPLDGVLIQAGTDHSARTDESGRFVVSDLRPSERHTITVTPADGRARRLSSIAVVGDRVTDVGTVWIGRAGVIDGHVRARDGSPIPGAVVSLHPGRLPSTDTAHMPDALLSSLLREPLELGATNTGATGDFEFEEVPAGPVTIIVRARGYQQALRRRVMITEGLAGGPLEVTLDRAAPVSGLVVDADGYGIPDARVALVPQMVGIGAFYARQVTRTGSDGIFHIASPPVAGALRLVVQADGYPTYVENLHGPPLAARIVLRRGAMIRLRIVDAETGEPLADARVLLLTGGKERSTPATLASIAQGVTDADGALEVAAQSGLVQLITIEHEHYGTSISSLTMPGMPRAIEIQGQSSGRVEDGENDWLVTCRPSVLLAGRVTGPDGTPVAGARCRGFGPAGFSSLAHTDVDGRYTVVMPASGPAPERLMLQVTAPGLVQSHDQLMKRPRMERAGTWTLDIALAGGGQATGRIISESGRPIAGAEVRAVPSQASRMQPFKAIEALTNRRGEYTVTGAPIGMQLELIASVPGLLSNDPLKFKAASGKLTRLPDQMLKPGASIVVRVVSPTGVPLPGARIEVLKGDLSTAAQLGPTASERRPDLTAGDGGLAYISNLPDGVVRLAALHDSYGGSVRSVEVDAEEPRKSPVVIRLENRAELTGRVRDSNGEPVENATIILVQRVGGEGEEAWVPPIIGASGADGWFVLEGVPGDGRFEARVIAPGYHARTIAVATKEVADVLLEEADAVEQEALWERAKEAESRLLNAESEGERRRLQAELVEILRTLGAESGASGR